MSDSLEPFPPPQHPETCQRLDVPREVFKPGWGDAIDDVSQDDKGRLIVGNSEYSSPVNFCPWCGFKGVPW